MSTKQVRFRVDESTLSIPEDEVFMNLFYGSEYFKRDYNFRVQLLLLCVFGNFVLAIYL